MTTLCLCDWVESQADREWRLTHAALAQSALDTPDGARAANDAVQLSQPIRLPFWPTVMSPLSESRP